MPLVKGFQPLMLFGLAALAPSGMSASEGELRAETSLPIAAPDGLYVIGVQPSAPEPRVAAVTESTFETEVLGSSKPVLVFCDSKRSAPAKEMTPVVAEIAERFAPKLQTVKLDVEENPALTRAYVISGVPYYILFERGSVLGAKAGKLSRDQLALWLEEELHAR